MGEACTIRYTQQTFHLSFVACGSAAGELLHPTLIFEGKRPLARLLEGWPDARLVMTDSGYQEFESFRSWAQDFVEQVKGPCILVLDNHSTRNDPVALEIFLQAKIQVITLHPHTTHLAQPLDKSFFRPFKTHLRTALMEMTQSDKLVTKDNIASLVKTAWEKTAPITYNPVTKKRSSPLISGFEATGCWPLDRSKLLELKEVKDADKAAANRASAEAAGAASAAAAAAGGGEGGSGDAFDNHDEEDDSAGEDDASDSSPLIELTAAEKAAKANELLFPTDGDVARLRKINKGRASEVSRLLTGREHVQALTEKIEAAEEAEKGRAIEAKKKQRRKEVQEELAKPIADYLKPIFAKQKGPAKQYSAADIRDWDIKTGPGPKVRIRYTEQAAGGKTKVHREVINVGFNRAWTRLRNASWKASAEAAAGGGDKGSEALVVE